MKMILKILLWPFRLIGVNIMVWSYFFRSLLPHPEIKKNDKFIVLKGAEISGLLHYNGPYTGGFDCTILEDTVVVAFSDSQRISMGFGCVPENKEEFEETYISEQDRNHPKYSGYSIIFKYRDLGKKIKILTEKKVNK